MSESEDMDHNLSSTSSHRGYKKKSHVEVNDILEAKSDCSATTDADSAIRRFVTITGTDEVLAHSILQDVDWKLEAALDAFFDNEDFSNERASTVSCRKEANGSMDLEGLEISLLSWNIDGLDGNSLATRMKAVSKIVTEISADFVFLQEVVEKEISTINRLNKLYKIYYSNRGAQYFTAVLVSMMFDVEKHEVIHYQNSGMDRTLQILEGRIGIQKVFLLNTHLESMKEHSCKRRAQFVFCMDKVREINKNNPGCLLFFGGDLNIRDNEVVNLPSGLADAWIAAGHDNRHEFTWDTRKNDNKQSFGARCRFDRVFWSGPLRKVSFSLEGKRRIRSCLCFPSDHWAVHCVFS